MSLRRAIWRDLLVLVGSFAFVWLLFSLFKYPGEPDLLSVEKEQSLGDKYMELVLANPMIGDFDNPLVDSALEVITDRLEEGLGESDYHYRFLIFESEMINAFTVPGGNILISSGLIAFCESPEELAAVIAHEMGHVEHRHVISRLVKELSLDILRSGDPFVMGEVTAMLSSSGFDRKQEEAADVFASQLMEDSHLEPRSLASLFRRLQDEAGNELMEHFEMVSTHPNFKSRIRAALLYRPAEDFEARALGLDWEAVRQELK